MASAIEMGADGSSASCERLARVQQLAALRQVRLLLAQRAGQPIALMDVMGGSGSGSADEVALHRLHEFEAAEEEDEKEDGEWEGEMEMDEAVFASNDGAQLVRAGQRFSLPRQRGSLVFGFWSACPYG
jgi:hypothetical protein